MNEEKFEQRITELEIRITHLEDSENTLNSIVIEQQELAAKLREEIVQLKSKIENFQDSQIANEKDETPPPHY